MKLFSNAARPVHMGPHALERLARAAPEHVALPVATQDKPDGGGMLSPHLRAYLDLFAELRDGDAAAAKAPVPDDPALRANDLKAAGYFMDAAMMGTCALDEGDRFAGDGIGGTHTHAVAVLVEHPRLPEDGNSARGWLDGAEADCAALRAAEIATVLAQYVRYLGFNARAHTQAASEVDARRLAVKAGLAAMHEGRLVNPLLDRDFAVAAVTMDYAVAADAPIALRAGVKRALKETLPAYVGLGGSFPGMERRRLARRKSHLSRYPMETIRRVAEPTTLILEDEVPRVPKRAAFFERALRGDLGEKSKRERSRFAFKQPLGNAMIPLIRAMVPHQGGEVAGTAAGMDDPAANARAIKSLMYALGADLVGICEAKPYTWFSHKEDGTPLEPYHKYAVVLLIDQGFETMEGASGDDFISGAQSMRGYLRGAEISGVAASFLRAQGVAARSHTNADSDVLQLPLVLLAGLGELSRIGELVLNPFVGPRFKSAVLTTDLPLEVDLPVDFGLQDMCNKCMKCARECPCDAISWGDKVMFNGYEMWKPDVERCTRYRLTNPFGSACGRCMKMCPYNHEGLLAHDMVLKASIHWAWTRRPIAWLHDWLGYGKRNLTKRWWFDFEMVDGVSVTPKGVNERDIDPSRKLDPDKQKMAYYPASAMPPPDAGAPVPVDRKAALTTAQLLETPAEARARRARGEGPPAHYKATPPKGRTGKVETVAGPYQPAEK